MDNFIIGISFGVLIASISPLLKTLVARIFKNKEKEMVVKESTGKETIITVKSNATPETIRESYVNYLNFERNIENALKAYQNINNDFKFYPGVKVDFIGEYGNKRIAIEAKTNTKNLHEMIAKYWESEPNINELILVVNSKVPQTFIEKNKHLSFANAVKFISAPEVDNLQQSLSNALDKEFKRSTA